MMPNPATRAARAPRRAGARTLVAALLLSSALPSCERPRDRSGVSDSLWVAAMARLDAINVDSTLDSAAKLTARRAALQERGLTQDALERKARALADDPDRAVA